MQITTIRQLRLLIWKEARQEWRKPYALSGVLVQMLATVFVTFLSVKILRPPVWNALFWVVLLFTLIHAVARSFIQESKGQMLYYHQLVHPVALILAKLIYNALLSLLLSLLSLMVYSLLLGAVAENWSAFLLVVLLFSVGLSSIFTMVSAIAAKASNSHLLMPVLSIPLTVPLMLVSIHAAKYAMDGIAGSLFYKDLGVLFLIDALILLLASVLYRFLWKE